MPELVRRRHHDGVWPRSPEELIDTQRKLAITAPAAWVPAPSRPLTIGACCVCFERGLAGGGARGDRAWAAAAVLRGKHALARAAVSGRAGAAYMPGLLALREGPCLASAVRALDTRPEVLLVDASGRDHPRGAGLALHLGAVLDLPTVGVTNRPLLARGSWPGDPRGATAPLMIDASQVATWLRTRPGARPVVVHPAWRTSVAVAVEVVMRATRGHRTPEPMRHARRLARTTRAGGG